MPQEQNTPMANALHSGAPQEADGGNAFAQTQPSAPSPGQPGQQPQRPAPSAEQAMAGITHFERLEKSFGELLKDPELGKKDMRSEIYEHAADLLGEGIATLPQIMGELVNLPKDPSEQFKWIAQHFQQAQQAAATIFRDYRASAKSSGDWVADGMAMPKRDKSKHSSIMSGLVAHYQSRKRA